MSKIAKATVGLMIVTLLCKILGFGRELILASIYGTSVYSDSYLIAMNIPTVIFSSIGAALSTTFIPLYFEVNNLNGEEKALRFANNVFNIVIIISIIMVTIGLVFTEPIVRMFAVGFEGETLKITIQFTRILIVGMLFIGLSNIMTAYLQINNSFNVPGMVSMPYNILIILSMIGSIWFGPHFMVWGTLLGIISQFLFQLPFAVKYSYKYQLYINIKDEYLKKMMILLGPVLIGVAVTQINVMIDKTLASTLSEGSISALNYANKLNEFVLGLFISSIAIVIYPMLSKLSSQENKTEIKKIITKSVNSIIILVLPISVGAIVLSKQIVSILFQRGAFDANATQMTSIALVMYSIGLIGFGLREILRRVFYSFKDTKTPVINGVLSMVINIVLNLILVKYMGHAGLALATSISSIICIFLLFISLNKKIGYFGQDKILKTMIKSLIASVVMGIVTYYFSNIIGSIIKIGFLGRVMSLIGSIGIGALVYGVIMIILKVEEIGDLINIIKKGKKSKVA